MYCFGGLSSSVSVMTIIPLSELGTLFMSLSEHPGKLGKVSRMIINSINNKLAKTTTCQQLILFISLLKINETYQECCLNLNHHEQFYA